MKADEKMKAVFRVLTDSLFPRRCPVCGEIADPPGNLICGGCAGKLDFVKEPVCMKCGRGIFDETEEYCYDCSRSAKSYERGFPLLNYDDRMREAMAQIKYRNRREYLVPFARLLYLRHGRELLSLHASALVPVPVHPSRLRKRGYNQAELLARLLGSFLSLPVRTDILYRTKRTAAQKKLTPEERLKNLTAAFQAVPCAGSGTLILVDDIYTTGSTVEACTKALLSAGASRVYYVSICIVPDI